MLSIYLIIIVSGLAAAGLSFLTWVILLLSLGGSAITTNVIAAIGLTYFLLHFLVLTLLRLNLKTVFHSNRANSGIKPTSRHPWITIASNISRILKRSPALRRAAWGVLAVLAVFLLLAKGNTKSQSRTD